MNSSRASINQDMPCPFELRHTFDTTYQCQGRTYSVFPLVSNQLVSLVLNGLVLSSPHTHRLLFIFLVAILCFPSNEHAAFAADTFFNFFLSVLFNNIHSPIFFLSLVHWTSFLFYFQTYYSTHKPNRFPTRDQHKRERISASEREKK